MKFRFYITNLFDGDVEGTNDASKADEMAECAEFFVVDADSGEWVQPGPTRVGVEEKA